MYDQELYKNYVQPYYLYLKTTRWSKEWKDLEQPPFVKLVQPALDNITQSTVEQLLIHRNWRHQVAGCWFAGIKGWSHYGDKVGSLLGKQFREVSACLHLYVLTMINQ